MSRFAALFVIAFTAAVVTALVLYIAKNPPVPEPSPLPTVTATASATSSATPPTYACNPTPPPSVPNTTISQYYGYTGWGASQAVLADPCDGSPFVVFAFTDFNPAGNSGNVGPVVALYNLATHSATLAQDFDPTTLKGGRDGHDAPFIAGRVQPGCAYISYGAVTIYRNRTHLPKMFDAATGRAGTSYAGMPTRYGCNMAGASDPGSFFNASNGGYLPSPGISEGDSAQHCFTPGCAVMVCGQTQMGVGWGIESGQHVCLFGRVTTSEGARKLAWITQCGQFTITYDTTKICSAEWNLSHRAYSGAWGTILLSSVSSGTASFNPPGRAACSAALSVATNGNAIASRDALIGAYNSNGNCPSKSTNGLYFRAVPAVNAHKSPGCTSGVGCIGLQSYHIRPQDIGSASNLVCGGSIRCGSWISNVNGNSSSFQFGTAEDASVDAEPYGLCKDCFIVSYDNQPTHNYAGEAESAWGLNFVLFIVQLQSDNTLKWCSVTGNHCIHRDLTNPGGVQPQLDLAGSGGGGSCTAHDPCAEPMPQGWCNNAVSPIYGSAPNCDGTENTRSPFLVRPCANPWPSGGFPPDGKPPFVYDYAESAQHNPPQTVYSGWGVALTPGEVHFAFTGIDSSGQYQNLSDIAVSTHDGTSRCTEVARSNKTIPYANSAVVVNYVSRKTHAYYVVPTFGNAPIWNVGNPPCSNGAGSCIPAYISHDDGRSFAYHATLVPATGGTNGPGSAGNGGIDAAGGVFAPMIFQRGAVYDKCTPGVDCTVNFFGWPLP